MPAEETSFEPPGREWPGTGELIRVVSREPVEEFEVTGFTETDEGNTAAVLTKGQEGIPGLYRLVLDGDWGDAIIQYHQPNYSNDRIEYEPDRKWVNYARLEDFFNEDGGEGYEVL